MTSTTSAVSEPAPASKPPVGVPIAGGITVLVGLISLCGGGVRLLNPEGGVDPDAFDPVFASGLVRATFYVSIAAWIALSVLAIVAGALLLAAHRRGRLLGLLYAWGSIAATVVISVVYAAKIVPALADLSLGGSEILRLAILAPTTGCCPTAWALVLLVVLHHDTVAAWAARR